MLLENLIVFKIFSYLFVWVEGAVVPPPWADPLVNPCAELPRGWQLLFWPPDGKCYKIFQMGYPCPDDMELSPAPTEAGKREFLAECRCPPKTAQSYEDGKCYELFTSGNCEDGFYFGPETTKTEENKSKKHFGKCKPIGNCPKTNEIFWPPTSLCYDKLTRGPCPRGQLLTTGRGRVARCSCGRDDETSEFRYRDLGCYQHFTRGPCREKGHVFLPEGSCGCYDDLPHFDSITRQCYEIGTLGPCSNGEQFQIDRSEQTARCLCKKNYVRYDADGKCYRPYTQGPCPSGYFLANSTSCEKQPCRRGELYFPDNQNCYKIGRRGPCKNGEVLTYDFATRPSVDGNSYNGVCRCPKTTRCDTEMDRKKVGECETYKAKYEGVCYRLYAQGPCNKGAWLAPKRRPRDGLWGEEDVANEENTGFCECMPGYTSTIRTEGKNVIVDCLSPTVILADYLNKNFISLNDTDNDK